MSNSKARDFPKRKLRIWMWTRFILFSGLSGVLFGIGFWLIWGQHISYELCVPVHGKMNCWREDLPFASSVFMTIVLGAIASLGVLGTRLRSRSFLIFWLMSVVVGAVFWSVWGSDLEYELCSGTNGSMNCYATETVAFEGKVIITICVSLLVSGGIFLAIRLWRKIARRRYS